MIQQMFNNMLSSIGSSVLRMKGGSYFSKEAEKANAQTEAVKPSIRQSEEKNIIDAYREANMPQGLTPRQQSKWRGDLRKQVKGQDQKVWDSYINEYMRATSKKSVIDRIALLEKAGGKIDIKMPEIGGKK